MEKRKRLMREVIQQIVATEAEAQRRVQSARQEAERILAEARKRAEELTASAQEEARTESRDILSRAATCVQEDRQTRLAGIAAGIEREIQLDDNFRQQTAGAVMRCICGGEKS